MKRTGLKWLGYAAALALSAVAGVTPAVAKEKFRIYLSMSYVGNDWQAQAQQMISAMAKYYSDEVDLRVQVAGPVAERQIQQINSMVQAGAKAIIVYPISPTALNGAIKNACNKGVVVFAYDSEVTEACAYNVHTDQYKSATITAQWVADALHGKGNILFVTGVPGTTVDTGRNAGARDVFKKYPDIKVVAETNGMWSQAVIRKNFTEIMATHKWSEIDGIWGQGGCLVGWAMQVEGGEKSRFVPCGSEGTNGMRVMMLPKGAVESSDPTYAPLGAPGISLENPPESGALALKLALKVLKGEKVPHETLDAPDRRHVQGREAVQGGYLAGDEGRLQRIRSRARPSGLVCEHLQPRYTGTWPQGRAGWRAGTADVGAKIARAACREACRQLVHEARQGLRRRGVSVAISVDRLTKNYGPTRALDGASFDVNKGDVHALLGENGAGKSTIVKVLSGLVRPNNGEVRIDGRILPFGSPRAARALGIATAFQEISQIPDLTVSRNLLLPEEPLRAGLFIDRAASRRRVAQIIEEQELLDIHPDADFRDLDLPLRQKIEIAKAVAHKPAILLLDEPTSALSGKDVDWLERRIAQACAGGATVILITHRLPEVRRFCSRLSVLRGGQHVGTFATETVSDDDVMSLIVGRSIGSAYPKRAPANLPLPDASPLLSVDRLAVLPRLEEATFQIRAGEILGVGGLQGMGQLELFNALFGIESPTAGSIEVEGRPVVLASPRDAVRAGVSLVPEERKTEGLALKLCGKHNVSLPVIDRLSRFGWIDSDREQSAVARILRRVQVHARALFMPCSAFSGGNQQKIVLAKWLLTDSRILLLFDPTRGVDIGTKREIFLLMHEFADAGGAILFYSTDTAELTHLCDRVAVIYRGRIAEILDKDDASEDRILRIALGANSPLEMAYEPAE